MRRIHSSAIPQEFYSGSWISACLPYKMFFNGCSTACRFRWNLASCTRYKNLIDYFSISSDFFEQNISSTLQPSTSIIIASCSFTFTIAVPAIAAKAFYKNSYLQAQSATQNLHSCSRLHLGPPASFSKSIRDSLKTTKKFLQTCPNQFFSHHFPILSASSTLNPRICPHPLLSTFITLRISSETTF